MGTAFQRYEQHLIIAELKDLGTQAHFRVRSETVSYINRTNVQVGRTDDSHGSLSTFVRSILYEPNSKKKGNTFVILRPHLIIDYFPQSKISQKDKAEPAIRKAIKLSNAP